MGTTTKLSGAAVAVAGAISATSAFADTNRDIERVLGCHHGSETHEWNAAEGRARQDGITVTGLGGQLNMVDPRVNYGEPLEGRIGFGISGQGSVKAWKNEGHNVDVPGRGNGYLQMIFSDVEPGDRLTFDDWGVQAVHTNGNYVGSVSGEINDDDISVMAGETSYTLSEVIYTTCNERRDSGGDDNGGGKSESGLSDGDVDGPSTSLN